MSLPRPAHNARLLSWSLTIGGCVCFAIGSLVLWRGQQSPIQRSFILLMSIFMLGMGLGGLLESSHPQLSSRFTFIGKVFAGFAIFALSWTLSHP